jgi:hypothetical protein
MIISRIVRRRCANTPAAQLCVCVCVCIGKEQKRWPRRTHDGCTLAQRPCSPHCTRAGARSFFVYEQTPARLFPYRSTHTTRRRLLTMHECTLTHTEETGALS